MLSGNFLFSILLSLPSIPTAFAGTEWSKNPIHDSGTERINCVRALEGVIGALGSQSFSDSLDQTYIDSLVAIRKQLIETPDRLNRQRVFRQLLLLNKRSAIVQAARETFLNKNEIAGVLLENPMSGLYLLSHNNKGKHFLHWTSLDPYSSFAPYSNSRVDWKQQSATGEFGRWAETLIGDAPKLSFSDKTHFLSCAVPDGAVDSVRQAFSIPTAAEESAFTNLEQTQNAQMKVADRFLMELENRYRKELIATVQRIPKLVELYGSAEGDLVANLRNATHNDWRDRPNRFLLRLELKRIITDILLQSTKAEVSKSVDYNLLPLSRRFSKFYIKNPSRPAEFRFELLGFRSHEVGFSFLTRRLPEAYDDSSERWPEGATVFFFVPYMATVSWEEMQKGVVDKAELSEELRQVLAEMSLPSRASWNPKLALWSVRIPDSQIDRAIEVMSGASAEMRANIALRNRRLRDSIEAIDADHERTLARDFEDRAPILFRHTQRIRFQISLITRLIELPGEPQVLSSEVVEATHRAMKIASEWEKLDFEGVRFLEHTDPSNRVWFFDPSSVSADTKDHPYASSPYTRQLAHRSFRDPQWEYMHHRRRVLSSLAHHISQQKEDQRAFWGRQKALRDWLMGYKAALSTDREFVDFTALLGSAKLSAENEGLVAGLIERQSIMEETRPAENLVGKLRTSPRSPFEVLEKFGEVIHFARSGNRIQFCLKEGEDQYRLLTYFVNWDAPENVVPDFESWLLLAKNRSHLGKASLVSELRSELRSAPGHEFEAELLRRLELQF